MFNFVLWNFKGGFVITFPPLPFHISVWLRQMTLIDNPGLVFFEDGFNKDHARVYALEKPPELTFPMLSIY